MLKKLPLHTDLEAKEILKAVNTANKYRPLFELLSNPPKV